MSSQTAGPERADRFATTPRGTFARWLWSLRYSIVYVGLCVWFVMGVASTYRPHTGFTSLLLYGDKFFASRLARLRDVPIYTQRDSYGYDGQFYSQIAVAGNPLDPELATALDSPSYRSRRVLLPLLAHVAGLGRPAWVLNIFALSNLFCWLTLAWLLGRWWFPPRDLHNLLRWIGTLFGAGTVASVTHSLTDVPALLAIVLGARCLEMNRQVLGTIALTAAGLVRETSILCAAAFVPPAGSDRQAWLRAARAAALMALPTLIWAAVLHLHYRYTGGERAVELPLSAFIRKLGDIRTVWRTTGLDNALRDEILVIVALVVQVAFVLSRWQPKVLWWRIGAAFGVLGIILGWPVWQGAAAAMRALLPLTVAFNILVPRTRGGLALLVAGNLTVLSAVTLLTAPPQEQTSFTHGVTCDYGSGWYDAEHLGRRVWRWAGGSTRESAAGGSATLLLHNSTRDTALVQIDFEMSSVTARTVELRVGELRKSIVLEAQKRIPARLGPFRLPPGDTPLTFTTAEPAWSESVASSRGLTFSVHNLDAIIRSAPDDPAGTR
jgi:hypothetical protein